MAVTWPSTTFVAGAVLTAAKLNTYLRDNTDDLNNRLTASIEAASAAVVTSTEATSSTSFASLATTGPTVTVATGTKVLVTIGALMYSTSTGVKHIMGFEVTGASTVAAGGYRTLVWEPSLASQELAASRQVLLQSTDGLTAGSNTFKALYRSQDGTAVNFASRTLSVLPLSST